MKPLRSGKLTSMQKFTQSLAVLVLVLGLVASSPAAAQVQSDDADLAGLTVVRPSTLNSLLSSDAIDSLFYSRTVQPPLAVPLNEPFAAATTEYTAAVGDHVRQVLVTPDLSDAGATATVNGSVSTTPVDLAPGDNVINVSVTAADGVTTKSYAVTVTRAQYRMLEGDLTGLTVADSNNVSLPLLPTASHVPHLALHQAPDFYPWITRYSVWVPSDVSSVTVTPTWNTDSDYSVEVRAATDFLHPTKHERLATTRVTTSGQTSTTIPLSENLRKDTEIWLGVHSDAGPRLYFVNVVRGTRQDAHCYNLPRLSPDAASCPQEPGISEVTEEPNPDAQVLETASVEFETPPGPVQGLTLTAKGSRVVVAWNAPTTGAAPEGYQVKLQDSDGGKAKLRRPGAKKLKIVYKKLEPGTTYDVSVRARNQWGKSSWTTSQITLG